MSCPFCAVPCGRPWCPYTEDKIEELRKLVQAREGKPVKFSIESKEAFTEALLKEMKDAK